MTYSTNYTGTYSWTTSTTSTTTSSRNWWSTPIGGWASYQISPPKKHEIVISEEEITSILEGDDNECLHT